MGESGTVKRAWGAMRVSVNRSVPGCGWDAIVVTAASPQQAELYQLHLRLAIHRRRISPHTVVLTVPDPHAKRIGSGGATLCALRQLALHLNKVNNNKDSLAEKRVLLVHAGGDSKRVPWANAIGKAFIPCPLATSSHLTSADEPVPLLFDHILAISSLALSRLSHRGGLFIMTGDVLPCFDASSIPFPDHGTGVVVVTTPASLHVAANHGVIVAARPRESTTGGSAVQVEDLLQKPSSEAMYARGAVAADSTALLDTGIFLVIGKAWQQLIQLSCAPDRDPVQMLLDACEEMSLYEEIAAAWVPARHAWLKTRPLGDILVDELGSQQLYHYCAYDLKFLHFGTSAEILEHLACVPSARRHFSYFDNDAGDSVAATSVILDSEINSSSATVGEGSLIFNSTLSSKLRVGSRCVVLNVHDNHETSLEEMRLPDKHCLWDVPLKNNCGRVVLCCGVEDNPKLEVQQGGTFCGKTWDILFKILQVDQDALWNVQDRQDLWNARIFPVVSSTREGVLLAGFLMGSSQDSVLLQQWQLARRLSLAVLQEEIDFHILYSEVKQHQCRIALGLAKACVEDGLINKDFCKLAGNMDASRCRETLSLITTAATSLSVSSSRLLQAQADISQACGDHLAAEAHQQNALQAVVAETSAAVICKEEKASSGTGSLMRLHPSRSSRVTLPVRIDFVGGWSDTPPWSVERTGRVLNMAVCLNQQTPVGAEVLLKKVPGISLSDDCNNSCWVEDPTSLKTPLHADDPFRLVKAGLIVTGWTNGYNPGRFRCSWGLEIKTWSTVPRGSGLGTSSILAAAVIRALLEVSDGDVSNENVARLVLVQEQVMGTGGGWQDQVGGIFPGLKCTSSFPEKPIRFSVQRIHLGSQILEELQERMLLVFTGQVRLASMVLQKVVTRYLQRDSVLIASIERLVELAKIGQGAFARGDVDRVGEVMEEAWVIHQELDPFCSNVFVDTVFEKVREWSCGYKLVGAGGGGFAIILAKSRDCAVTIRNVLGSHFGHSLQFFSWSLHE